MQRREPPNYFFDTVDAERHLADSRSLTKDLPAARLTLLDGSSMMISVDPDATAAVLAFLRECDERLENAGSGSVRTMVFIDLADHTRMMQRLGDQRGRDVLRDFERLTRSALASHGGVEIKSMGDGFLASFASAQRALECALTVERACSAYESETLSVRIGVNAGEPIVEESDLFGASVITAARVASRAAGGQVVVSDVVRLLVAGKGFSFRDLGEQSLKGLDEPVRIWELALDEVSGSG